MNLLAHFAQLFDSIVGLLTLGLVHSGLEFKIFMKLTLDEVELRKNRKETDREEWPRIQIWPHK